MFRAVLFAAVALNAVQTSLEVGNCARTKMEVERKERAPPMSLLLRLWTPSFRPPELPVMRDKFQGQKIQERIKMPKRGRRTLLPQEKWQRRRNAGLRGADFAC